MHIGIYTQFLKPGRIGGSETYTRNLIEALGRIDHQNQYHIFTTSQNQSLFNSLPPNFHNINQTVSLTNLDLIHFPGTTIHSTTQNIPCVITVHDLQHLYWPGFFSFRERLRRWRQDRPSIHKASHIIAISEFTRMTIAEKYPNAAGKITNIYSGVTTEFFKPVPNSTKDQLKQKYNLPPTFALYPARPWPHKNHKRLLEAFLILKRQHSSCCRLVLCGFNPDEVPAGWRPLLDSLGDDTVQIVGYIPKQEMPTLYQMADFLVFPSLFEGFGLPILEAMAAGCPVISSNSSSLPEIAGNAAVFIDPFDNVALAQAMHNLLTNNILQQTLSRKGKNQAQYFSWEATALATLKVYKGVIC